MPPTRKRLIMPQKIGEMNGKWALLFKAILACASVCFPLIVAFEAWQCLTIMSIQEAHAQHQEAQARQIQKMDSFMELGPRYTEREARADNISLKGDLIEYVSNRCDDLDKKIDRLQDFIEDKHRN